ncbi:MAG: cytosolic protein [Actinomycetota bacterium]
MKVGLLFTASGSLVIITSFDSLTNAALVAKLKEKGIPKFIAYEIPVELAKERYGSHFHQVTEDLHETDDLRVLDDNGQRAFKLFSWRELGQPMMCEDAAS